MFYVSITDMQICTFFVEIQRTINWSCYLNYIEKHRLNIETVSRLNIVMVE